MRWLHLSDLHVGRDNSAQKNAIASLVAAIEKFGRDADFDAILLTGDLVYSGHPDEYARLEALVLAPLLQLPMFRHSKVLAVPGNHDIDCDVVPPISWDRFGVTRQQEFFSRSDKGRRLRQFRAAGFDEYEKFAARCGVSTCRPSEDSVSVFTITDRRGSRVDCVCLEHGLLQ